MTIETIIISVIAGVFALCGAGLLVASMHGGSAPRPETRAISRAGRPAQSSPPARSDRDLA